MNSFPPNVERIRSYCLWDNDNWNTINFNTTTWDIDGNAGKGVVVSIIDTGMFYNIDDYNHVQLHPDLNDTVKGMVGFHYNGASVDNYTLPIQDYEYIADTYQLPNKGHGNMVAGVIAAAINQMGLIGAAPNVSLYSLKINSINVTDYGAEEEMAAAINYSVNTLHARVISISLGFPEDIRT
jgi:subtilisin